MTSLADDTRIPMLVVGDSPLLPTGLGRILRDVTELIRRHVPEVRLAQLGLYHDGRRANWHVYPCRDEENWGKDDVAAAWEDHLGIQPQDEASRRSQLTGKPGIIFSFWDPGRCPGVVWGVERAYHTNQWKARPHFWGYFAVDSADARGKLGGPVGDTLGRGYQRVLAYSRYGAKVLEATLGRAVSWLPHGIDCEVFKPRDPRVEPPLHADDWLRSGWPIVGVVATNHSRKDLGAVFAALEGLDCHLWLHTNKLLTAAWSVQELAEQYGRDDERRLLITTELDDEQLARWYSACAATVAPGLGEGFGYPIAESLACGTPVVHVDYAAGPEWVPVREWLFGPRAFRLEGPYALVRPVVDPREIRKVLTEAIRWRRDEPQVVQALCRVAVEHLDWRNLWSHWEAWVRQGLEQVKEGAAGK